MEDKTMKKVFGIVAMLLALAACNKIETEIQTTDQAEGITITATLAPKTAVSKAVSDQTTYIEAEWAENEHIAILYEVSSTQYVADATITAVDGSGTATISFTVEAGTPDNTACTLIYPAMLTDGETTVYNDDLSGVKDAATLLGEQDGTLNANLDVRVGDGTIQTTTPGLTVTTQPEAQFAIFKFTTQSVPDANSSLQNTNVTKLTVNIGGQDYVITPSDATSTLYAALPAASSQAVSFTATDGSNFYAASKDGISFTAGKYYQSTVKMGKVIEVFGGDSEGDPRINLFVGPDLQYDYLHIGLDQAYSIAKQLSTQNNGARAAVLYDDHYNNDNGNYYLNFALSIDDSATRYNVPWSLYFYSTSSVLLATLWEEAD